MTLNFGRWDFHSNNFNGLKKRLLPPDDRGFNALIEDLEQRGLLDSTLVVWTGEFGRSPRIGKADVTKRIAPAGRDHWPFAYSIGLIGGGVKQGYIHGRTDKIGAYPAERPTEPAEVVGTIYRSLGLDLETALPGPAGRPFPLVDYGKHEIKELF